MSLQQDGKQTIRNEKPREITDRTFDLALEIVRLCRRLERQPDVCRTLSWQLLRSGTSIGANMEEAQAAQSRADFVSKCTVSLKEARETIYWLKLIRGLDPAKAGEFDPLIQEADEVSPSR